MPGYSASSGPADILASGTVITLNREPITISFRGKSEEMTVIFSFVDEPGDTGVSVRQVAPLGVELTLRNFKNTLPAGSSTALQLGFLGGLAVYLHFRVQDLGTGDKTLHFSVFQLRPVRS